jgi:hypothetical protein
VSDYLLKQVIKVIPINSEELSFLTQNNLKRSFLSFHFQKLIKRTKLPLEHHQSFFQLFYKKKEVTNATSFLV